MRQGLSRRNDKCRDPRSGLQPGRLQLPNQGRAGKVRLRGRQGLTLQAVVRVTMQAPLKVFNS